MVYIAKARMLGKMIDEISEYDGNLILCGDGQVMDMNTMFCVNTAVMHSVFSKARDNLHLKNTP